MKKIIVAITLLCSSVSHAAGIWCSGEEKKMYIDSGKNVYINGSWRNHYTEICKTDGSRGNIDIVTCSHWIAMVNSAIIHNKHITIHYDDNNGQMTCANIPEYTQSPTPIYVMLKEPGS